MSEKTESTDTSPDSTANGEKPELPAEDFGQPEEESLDSKEIEESPESPGETADESSDSTTIVQVKQTTAWTLPANLLTACTSITWIAVFIFNGVAGISLPWSITLSAVAFWALSTTRKQKQMHAFAASRIGTPEEGRFARYFSTTYLSVSLILFAWLYVHGFKVPTPVVSQRQFIDIELTSFADFKDNNSLTASTEEKDSQRKRSGSTDKISMTPPVVQPQSRAADRTSKKTEEAGKRALQSVAPKRITAAPTEMVLKGVQVQSAVNSLDAVVAAQQQKAETKARLVSQVKLPSGWKSVQADQTFTRQNNTSPGVRSEQSRASNESMFMEESSPVELFEVVDNEGDAGIEIFQSGGRSSGGKGAPSTLQEYLKQLHKRIKRAWSPPNGDPRVAQILFRITKEGKLKQIRLVRSSGNSDCDESAINAITACAPFKGLPADFAADCLDIKYTFNYKIDSLSEVPAARIR
ncbi:MAG: TonB C-terminal domain-containing protein [Candidatus Obscuribacterales bacterium]|nr:TonB C-terminal domain-containing protein [Candidatus Obscuribacterales bacterium]